MDTEALKLATDMIIKWEGFSATPYQDTGGIWTIGFGSIFDMQRARVTATTPPITKAQGIWLVTNELANAIIDLAIESHQPMTEHEQAAFLDFIYNCGRQAFNGSTILKLWNAGDKTGAIQQLTKWDHVSSKVIQGLLNRRLDEIKMAQTPDTTEA